MNNRPYSLFPDCWYYKHKYYYYDQENKNFYYYNNDKRIDANNREIAEIYSEIMFSMSSYQSYDPDLFKKTLTYYDEAIKNEPNSAALYTRKENFIRNIVRCNYHDHTWLNQYKPKIAFWFLQKAILDITIAKILKSSHYFSNPTINLLERIMHILELDKPNSPKKEIDKERLYAIIKSSPTLIQIQLLYYAMQLKHYLGQCFWKQRGIQPCHFATGTLRMIKERFDALTRQSELKFDQQHLTIFKTGIVENQGARAWCLMGPQLVREGRLVEDVFWTIASMLTTLSIADTKSVFLTVHKHLFYELYLDLREKCSSWLSIFPSLFSLSPMADKVKNMEEKYQQRISFYPSPSSPS